MSDLEKRWLDITNDYNPTISSQNMEELLNKIKDFSIFEDKINKKFERISNRINDLNEKFDTLISLCQKIDSNIIRQNEREVNLQIRKYSIQNKNKTITDPPIHFVPSSTINKNHFGLFTGLLR